LPCLRSRSIKPNSTSLSAADSDEVGSSSAMTRAVEHDRLGDLDHLALAQRQIDDFGARIDAATDLGKRRAARACKAFEPR